MDMIDRDQIMLVNKISYLYSAFDNNGKKYITVQNLLEHNSGRASTNLGLQATYDQPFPTTPEQLITNINNLKLDYKTENKTLYSELGPIVLGQVISKITKKSLPDAFFQIMTIIGLRDTVYRPNF
jgi:CubicO group peptidase (beta-lactamase class C family)